MQCRKKCRQIGQTQKQKLLHTVLTAFCVDNRIVAIRIKEGKPLHV